MPELYHPDLDVVIDVDDNRARNRRAAGWVDVTDVDTADNHVDTEPGDDPDDVPSGDVETATSRED